MLAGDSFPHLAYTTHHSREDNVLQIPLNTEQVLVWRCWRDWSRIREQRHVVNRIFDWLEELQPGLAPHQGRVTEHWIMLFVRQCVERGPRQPRTHTLSLTLISRVTTLFEQLLQLWVVPFFNIAWTRPTSPTLPLPPDHDLNNKFLFELFARRGQHWQSWGRN